MFKQQAVGRINNGMKILFGLAFLIFFVYSFQTIMDLEGITHPSRQESFMRVLTALSQPNLFEGETSRQVVAKMWETFQIGFLATTLSAIFAIPFTFLSGRPSSFWGSAFNILLQPILSAVRAVHPLITIIPAIILMGIGSTAGVLALTLFSTAVFIIDFSEYTRQHASLRWPVLFKVHFPGIALKHLPVNILIATVLGFMGGGGIGSLLQLNIHLLNFSDASVAILACIIVIGGLDLIGRFIWHKIQNHTASIPSTPESANLD